MDLDRISEERLFQNNTKEEINKWCNDLQFFHYMRARGGHNCEGDSFCAYFKYENKNDLILKLSKIGITLDHLAEGDIAFNPLDSYSIDDLDRLKVTIREYPDLIQPQNIKILDQQVHVWIIKGSFEISVSGSKDGLIYKVSEQDFLVCKQLEDKFNQLNWGEILDESIENQIHCISKKLYPEIFNL